MPDQPHDDRTRASGWFPPEPDNRPTDTFPVMATEPPAGAVAVSGRPAPPAPGVRARRRRRGLLIGLIATLVVVLAVAGFYVVDVLRTGGQIERGTTIAGVAVGGLTPAEATRALQTQLGPSYRAPVALRAHDETITVNPAEAGLTPDIAGAVAAAGIRSASPVARFSSFWRTSSVPLTVQVDPAVLTTWVRALADRTDIAAVDGSITRSGAAVITVDPVIGRHLQVAKSVQLIEKGWRTGGPAAVNGLDLPTTTETVRVSAQGLAAAKQKAQAVLAGPLTVRTAVGTLPITRAQVAAAVTISPDRADGFTVAVDSSALRKVVQASVDATRTTPKDAVLALRNGRPTITGSITGRTANWDATEKTVVTALMSRNRVWTVVYDKKEADFSTADAKALGLNEVISEFTTSGFAFASGVNIQVVAEKVQGVIVMPGKTFSLNGFTGPRTETEGYIPAGVIQAGAISTAVGGGISQFATTLYNAAYFAGMGDVHHQPHSFYISRYPPGREATVFDGEIDLAFSNDYPTAVLIQTIWTENDITVRIWGTKHVQVQSQTTDPFDYTAAPTVTVPYGQSCNASEGSSGYSVVNTRIIKDLAGNEIRREKFTTVYNGHQHVICEPLPPASSAPGSAVTRPSG